jgi:transcription elongation factor SPT5
MADNLNHDLDEESDDGFNPAPADLSDNENDADLLLADKNARRRSSEVEGAHRPRQKETHNNNDDEGDEEEEEEDGTSVKPNAVGSDDEGDEGAENEGAGEDLDEEDEDEEEEEDRPRKRHKRDRRNQFIDVEAEVDDEDEEEDEEEDGLPGDEIHPDDLVAETGADHDDRRHRELDRKRELEASLDAEKQAAALRERHGRRNRTAMAEVSGIPQHLLLPSVEDPKIWLIRVKHGKEAEVINLVMKRYADRMDSREPLRITSAFGRGGSTMAGYIYVEARQQADVFAATEDISFCYPRTKCEMVPLSQMPDLLRTTPPKALETGMWVRIKRPAKYAGDLAQIEDAESNGSDVTVKIIPRIDYGLEEDLNGPASKRKRPGFGGIVGPRPPQRLFSEIDARKKMGRYLQHMTTLGRQHYNFQNEQYIDGFLIKDMKVSALQTDDVNPTLEEVSRFASGDNEGHDNLDLASIAASLKANTATSDYLPGDKVEIYQGEQQGVRGQAVSVRGDIVTIKVTEGDLQGQRIEAPVKGLRKLFKEGDHVKVIGGSKYHDEVGMVVRVKDDRVTMLTDSNNHEITVFSKDLREASDSSSAQGYSKYDLYDLVQLDATTVACVIKIDRESLRVLDQNGSVRTLLPSNISNKIERRRHAVATDREGSEIRGEDTVKEYSGEQRQGRVLHIHRNFLFIQNRQQAENAGIFVSRSANVQTVAAKGGRVNAGPDLTKMNPLAQRNGGPGATTMGPPKPVFGRDKLIGKTVSIKRGPHKGLLGIVKDTTDDQARVELHTKNKIVTVPKDAVVPKDPVTGAALGAGRGGRGGFGGGPGRFGAGTPGSSRVPDYAGGSRTPMAAASGGRTPAWGQQQESRTPAWQSASANGGRTPAWSQANQSNRTPAWTGGNDGSRTSYGGDGSRTAYGGRTEYGGAGQVSSVLTLHEAS